MRQIFVIGGMVATAGLIGGCQTAPPAQQLPPASRLLSSAPLQLPDNCIANGSFVVHFAVDASGRPGNIQPPPADACVQTALTSWVASFQYAPQPRATPMSVEWLMVTAKKGG